MTLSEFLLARIAEDEEAAAGWRARVVPAPGISDWVLRVGDRVLAECGAKRHIIELHYSWNLQAEHVSDPVFGPIHKAQAGAADAILRVLSLPYADHPDYDPAWKP